MNQTSMAFYVYCFLSNDYSLKEPIEGLHQKQVQFIELDGIVAACSPIKDKKIRQNRANLMAHMQVQKKLMEFQTILPIAFGTIVPGKEKVLELLKKNKDSLTESLQKVAGYKEYGIIIKVANQSIFDFILQHSADLRELKEAHKDRQLSRNETIEIGQRISSEMELFREKTADLLITHCTLEGCQLKTEDTKSESELARASILMKPEQEDRFYEQLEIMDRELGWENLLCQVNGPWAPANFIDLRLVA